MATGSYPSGATALLIDDEPTLRSVVRRCLEPDICAVVEAEDGEMGLETVQRGTSPVDLVIVDLMLPGVNGLQVIETLTRTRPELPLLCITGFGATAVDLLEPLVRDFHIPVLTKPFTSEALAQAVSDLLERASRRGQHLSI